jgi:hypothetical protein
MTEQLVAPIPETLKTNRSKGRLTCFTEDGKPVILDYKLAKVRVKKTDEEIKQAKRTYRREYARRPQVKERIKKRLENPESKEKRLRYASKEEVKERKKFLAARNRKIRNELKRLDPELYRDLEKDVTESMRATNKADA